MTTRTLPAVTNSAWEKKGGKGQEEKKKGWYIIEGSALYSKIATVELYTVKTSPSPVVPTAGVVKLPIIQQYKCSLLV